jgi:hypothetical protein
LTRNNKFIYISWCGYSSLKKIKFDFSRPDGLFALIWITALSLAFFDLYFTGFDFSLSITLLIFFNILSFILVYRLLSKKISIIKKCPHFELNPLQHKQLTKANHYLLTVWVFMFLINIYFSDGLPLIWRLMGLNRSYVEFGLPTLTGFTNLLRCFILSLSIWLFVKYRHKKNALIVVLMIISSIFELSRGNTIYLLLFGIAVILLLKKINLSLIGILLASSICFICLFGLVEHYRYPASSRPIPLESIVDKVNLLEEENATRSNSIPQREFNKSPEMLLREKIRRTEELRILSRKEEIRSNWNSSFLRKLPMGFTSVYIYISTPLNNLYFAKVKGIIPLGYPYYTLQLLVPSIIRIKYFRDEPKYPIVLRSNAYNATTFYSPLIADFGVPLAALLVVVIQIIVCFVHLKAKQGDFYSQLSYTPLFMSICLSFFFNYFFSLGVLLFPVLVYGLKYYINHIPTSLTYSATGTD